MALGQSVSTAEDTPLLIVLSILAVGLYLLVHFLRKPVSTADPEEVPLIGRQVAAKIETPDPQPTPPADPKSARSRAARRWRRCARTAGVCVRAKH